MKAPLPDNEAQRLETLRSFGILDTLPERDFDDLALLASQICGTPMAMVSLIDADRQWFKAKIGVAATQTPRDLAFCAHAILQADLFIIPDALADERFLHNPFVTGDPRIRFYAGAPLLAADGHALGTLCVLDSVPRELTAKQAESLRALSRQVVSQLELRRAWAELSRASTQRHRAGEMLRLIAEGTAALTGSDFLRSLVRHVASALEARYAFVTECQAEGARARTRAFWNGDRFGDNFEYDTAPTPCLKVLRGGVVHHPGSVQELYPEDTDLPALAAESYFGIPLMDSSGRVIGHLAVMDVEPMDSPEWAMPVLRVFAARAGAELERLRAEERRKALVIAPATAAPSTDSDARPADGGESAGPSSLEDLERRHIQAMLDRSGGVIEGPRGAARVLGLHPNTLRSRMKKLGIKRSASRAGTSV